MAPQSVGLDEIAELLRSLLQAQREANSKLHEIADKQGAANDHLKVLADEIRNREVARNPLGNALSVIRSVEDGDDLESRLAKS
ncbi:hypothetical protein ABC365_02220 [Brevundimonas sp. 3P9-tot-E]|uniref:hypothetical protein n=1 Tax=unclassified Brevundimonas TaxID=2622653 RepID=UPI0039A26753